MTTTSELAASGPDGPEAAGERPPPRVLVVDADGPLFGLLEEWLAADGYVVLDELALHRSGDGSVDLVIVDVPFPRQAGVDWIRRIAARHPMAPILALSSTFIAGIECCGPVARALGVACVLPNPCSRDALLRIARRLIS
jgi:CheY-like chemotaxis protein